MPDRSVDDVSPSAWPRLTPAGRGVLLMVVVSAPAAVVAAWAELVAVVALGLSLLLLAAVAALRPLGAPVVVELRPTRLAIGDKASIVVRRGPGRGQVGVAVELPVGPEVVRFRTGSSDVVHRREFLAVRRGVYRVGPARAVREDALRLVRRTLVWDQHGTLYVRPAITPLAGIGSGLLRDLEGTVSRTISHSDGELHALRAYMQGDDPRLVDWRSSARSVDGSLLVRQYVEIRRSHLLVVLADQTDQYVDAEDFETAVSVAASLGVHALGEKQRVSLLAGRVMASEDAHSLLDSLSAVTMEQAGLLIDAASQEAALAVPSATLVVLVTGTVTPIATIEAAAHRWGPQVAVLTVRCGAASGPRLHHAGSNVVLTVPDLEVFPGLLAAAVRML